MVQYILQEEAWLWLAYHMATGRFEFGQLISMATGYVFLVSACYWLSYWYKLGVPIINYMTVSDLLVRSVIPLLFLSTSIFPLLFLKTVRISEEPDYPTIWERFSSLLLPFVFVIVLSTIGGLLHYLSATYLAGFFYVAVIGVSLYAVLTLTKLTYLFEISTGLSGIVLHLLVFVLLSSAAFGFLQAARLIDGEKYLQFETRTTELEVDGELAYLGEAGDRIFLWSYERQTALVVGASAVPTFYLVQQGQSEPKQ